MLFRRNLLRNCDILVCFCMQSSLKILSGPNTHEAELNFYTEALIMRSATTFQTLPTKTMACTQNSTTRRRSGKRGTWEIQGDHWGSGGRLILPPNGVALNSKGNILRYIFSFWRAQLARLEHDLATGGAVCLSVRASKLVPFGNKWWLDHAIFTAE